MANDALPELTFPAGLPGFPHVRRFALVEWGGDGSPFSLLRSLEDPELAFVVAHPLPFFPQYEPEVDDDTVDRLGLASADDAVVLVIITLADEPADATANLAGPIVVNRHTREAVQTVLTAPNYDLHTPLVSH